MECILKSAPSGTAQYRASWSRVKEYAQISVSPYSFRIIRVVALISDGESALLHLTSGSGPVA
jgi:hypothetical protein